MKSSTQLCLPHSFSGAGHLTIKKQKKLFLVMKNSQNIDVMFFDVFYIFIFLVTVAQETLKLGFKSPWKWLKKVWGQKICIHRPGKLGRK